MPGERDRPRSSLQLPLCGDVPWWLWAQEFPRQPGSSLPRLTTADPLGPSPPPIAHARACASRGQEPAFVPEAWDAEPLGAPSGNRHT